MVKHCMQHFGQNREMSQGLIASGAQPNEGYGVAEYDNEEVRPGLCRKIVKIFNMVSIPSLVIPASLMAFAAAKIYGMIFSNTIDECGL